MSLMSNATTEELVPGRIYVSNELMLGCTPTTERKCEDVFRRTSNGIFDSFYSVGPVIIEDGMPWIFLRWSTDEETAGWIINKLTGGGSYALILVGDEIIKVQRSPFLSNVDSKGQFNGSKTIISEYKGKLPW